LNTTDLLRRGNVAKEDRGFASMDRSKQRDIASKGGKAAHQKGTAHEWTSEEAREAGRKGGMASHRRKQGEKDASTVDDHSASGSVSEPDIRGNQHNEGNPGDPGDITEA
jgi:general stress protein YciG